MLIAIDYGTARVGIAVSDQAERFALPHAVIEASKALSHVCAMLQEHAKAISAVIVGLPLHANGTESASSHEAKEFARRLAEEIEVPVVLFDERRTSLAASAMAKSARIPKNQAKSKIDQVAAQIILEGYMTALFDNQAAEGSTLAAIKQQADEMKIPAVRPMTVRKIVQELAGSKARNLLEIGTANGYSAAYLAYCLPFLSVTTIEKDESRSALATGNLARLRRVKTVHADALDYNSPETFDAIFVDGPKATVARLVDRYWQHLAENGQMFVDNLLLKAIKDAPDAQTNPQKRRLIEKTEDFVAALSRPIEGRAARLHDFEDGLAILTKVKRPE